MAKDAASRPLVLRVAQQRPGSVRAQLALLAVALIFMASVLLGVWASLRFGIIG
jgi:hypothetical protein